MGKDITQIIISSLQALGSNPAKDIVLLVLISLAFSALTWTGVVLSAKLWNKSYHTKPISHLLGFIAATFSYFFIVVFISFSHLETTTKELLDVWGNSLKLNQEWQSETFQEAFYAAKELDSKGFIGVTIPKDGGNIIPINNNQTRIEVANLYANQANQNFKGRHSFLSKLLIGNNVGSTKKQLEQDILNYFEKNKDKHNIYVAGTNIKKQLEKRINRVVILARTGLFILFLIIQFIPFGFISYQAYKDLKIKNNKIWQII